MNLKINKGSLIFALINIILLTAVIFFASYISLNNKPLIGFVLIFLGLLSFVPILLFKIPFKILKGDIIFGTIDNGILAIFTLSGAELFGILGAVIGALVGNAITDGIAGIFEGYEWQKLKKSKYKENRTALTVAIGKLAGCLIGAGIVLAVAWSI